VRKSEVTSDNYGIGQGHLHGL